MGKIDYYKNGITYYSAKIEHFGDTYAYWKAPETGTTDTYAANHLGRWGVVRNNWYDLSITKISRPGTPVIPEFTDDWDDQAKYWISLEVNTLSWAKRSQSIDF